MVQIILDSAHEVQRQQWLVPDLVWQTDIQGAMAGFADFVLADDGNETGFPDVSNIGGLQAKDALATAIILCLFTDRRRPDGIEDFSGSNERRGWWGNRVDVDQDAGERELGSLLWTLQRALPNDETGTLAVAYAHDALQTLIDQGIVSQLEITYEFDRPRGVMALNLTVTSDILGIYFTQKYPVVGNV